MPAYNAERFVAKSIESALAQTYRPIELLVADDGSKDGTSEVVQRYDAPVRYLHHENRGPAGARNLAIRHATGKYVAFLDSDDLWHPEKLTIQVAIMEAHPEVSICGTQMIYSHEPEKVEWPPLPSAIPQTVIQPNTLAIYNRFSTSTVMVRTEVLRAAGEFDENPVRSRGLGHVAAHRQGA